MLFSSYIIWINNVILVTLLLLHPRLWSMMNLGSVLDCFHGNLNLVFLIWIWEFWLSVLDVSPPDRFSLWFCYWRGLVGDCLWNWRSFALKITFHVVDSSYRFLFIYNTILYFLFNVHWYVVSFCLLIHIIHFSLRESTGLLCIFKNWA